MNSNILADWQRVGRPDLQGFLLLHPNRPDGVEDLLIQCAPNRTDYLIKPLDKEPSQFEYIDGGSQGLVYRCGELAIKAFNNQSYNPKSIQRATNEANLRANVALEAAIDSLSVNTGDGGVRLQGVTYTSLRHYGAFIPSTDSDPAISPYWVMNYEPSSVKYGMMPPAIRRRYENNQMPISGMIQDALTNIGADASEIQLGEAIHTAKPIVRYDSPSRRNLLEFLRISDPYEQLDFTVVLHDVRAA